MDDLYTVFSSPQEADADEDPYTVFSSPLRRRFVVISDPYTVFCGGPGSGVPGPCPEGGSDSSDSDEDTARKPESGTKSVSPERCKELAEKAKDRQDYLTLLARETGFADEPEVVSEEALDAAIAAGATELARGVQTRAGADAVRRGNSPFGDGKHGPGIYVYYGDDPEGYASGWALGGGHPRTFGAILRMALPKDAKLIGYREATEMLTQRQKELASSKDDATVKERRVLSMSTVALLAGYDGIRVDEKEMVVLNRSILKVQQTNSLRKRPKRYPDSEE